MNFSYFFLIEIFRFFTGNLIKETKMFVAEVKKTKAVPPSDSGEVFVKAMEPVAAMIEKKTNQLNEGRTKMKDSFNLFVESYASVRAKKI